MSDFPEFKPDEMPEDQEGLPPEEALSTANTGGSRPESALAGTPGTLGAGQEEETEAVKEPTRFQLFVRKALIWLGMIAGGFLAGFLTFYFVLYQPKADALDAAESEVLSLQSQVASLTSRVDALQGADQHRALLAALVDAYDARLAMSQEDLVSAKSALADISDPLDEVLPAIKDFDSGLADVLPQRISLIRTNLDRDLETAMADCDQLIKDLIEVEQALFQ